MAAIVFDRPASPARPTTRAGATPRWARLEAGPVTTRTVPTMPARSMPARWRRERQTVFRRRRLVVAFLLMAAAFAAGVLLAVTLLSSPAGGSLTEEARHARQVTYVVGAGDTLWRVAGAVAPAEDPRAVVDALSAARGSSAVVPGDVIVWPPG